MEEPKHDDSVEFSVARKYLRTVETHSDKICAVFGLKSLRALNNSDENDGSDRCESVSFQVISDSSLDEGEIAKRLQHYIESLAIAEAEDSSYDSDCENDDIHSNSQNIDHEQVSRTTSDTLGQEFAEYVTKQTLQQPHSIPATTSPTAGAGAPLSPERSPGYTARVEFALKLGYTERLVQAALARLGPDPAQNELLGELIKLGALHGNKGDFCCDSPTAECLSPDGSSTSLTSAGLTGGDGAVKHPLTATCSFSDDASQQVNRLRPIVIDGSNVAMSHGNKEVFSCRGIKLCVDWFKNRGHKDIVVFVPKWRKESARPDNPVKDQEILNELERDRMLVFTPSRLVGGKRMTCYDDRYILKLAVANDGIVVSNDNYRDLVQESSEFKKVVEERVLMYSFVNDRFMPPDDPLGRSGPTLDNFLRIQPKKCDPPPCPYGKKCTYGNKCKFHHPERGLGPHKSVTERLSEHAARHLSARNSSGESVRQPVQGKSLSVPLSGTADTIPAERTRKPLCRTRSGQPDCTAPKHTTTTLGQPSPQQTQQHSPIWDPVASCHLPLADTTHMGFPKSHSIENISREIYTTHPHLGMHPNYASLWSSASGQQPGNTASAGGSGATQKPPSTSEAADESINLHRKLKRQLTLNPAGCDPRIYQMQRCLAPTGGGGSGGGGAAAAAAAAAGQPLSPHRLLTPSLSGPRSHHPPSQWDLHQSVTRIASAPDPSRPWHNGPPPASSSEPHINLWPHHAPATVLAAQDQRRRLHYHLSSIFPEEQVQRVMQMYPDETNPQTICAAILSMFPKI